MPNELVVRDQITEALHDSLHRGMHGLSALPGLLKRALEERAWEERIVRSTGERFPGFPSFEAYVQGAPPEGLGGEVKVLRELLKSDVKALDLLDKALQHRHGGPRGKNDNINLAQPNGTNAEQALRRLRKDRPDLYARVLAGELSPHGAAVEAGFRPRTATVRLDDMDSLARTLRRRLTPKQLVEVVCALKL
jgi:hypothetical protein